MIKIKIVKIKMEEARKRKEWISEVWRNTGEERKNLNEKKLK